MAVSIEDVDRRTGALERAQGETTETLRWTVAKLGRIQAVQDEHTLRLERIEARIDRVEIRLDHVEARLESLEAKVDALPRAVAEMMADMIAASEKRLMAAIASRQPT